MLKDAKKPGQNMGIGTIASTKDFLQTNTDLFSQYLNTENPNLFSNYINKKLTVSI